MEVVVSGTLSLDIPELGDNQPAPPPNEVEQPINAPDQYPATTRITTNVHDAQPFAVNENMYTYKGKYFRTYYTWIDDSPLEVQVSYYDHDSGEFGPVFSWGIPSPGATDTHALPSIIVSADGYILIAQEQLEGTHPVNDHESEVHFRRSTNPEDLSSWEPIDGSPLSDELSYSHFARLPNGNIIYIARQNTFQIACFISEDNGQTFRNFDGVPISSNEYVNAKIVSLPNGQWAYQHLREVDGGIAMSIQVRDNAQSYPTSYMLFSKDGITWGNWAWYNGSGWHKDTSANGAISFNELRTNCLVLGDSNQLNAPANNNLRRFRVAGGYLAMIYWHTPQTGGNTTVRFKVVGPRGEEYYGGEILENIANTNTVDFGPASIIPMNPARGAYQLLIKDFDEELILLETTSYGKSWRKIETITDHGLVSDVKDRGYDYYDPIYNIWGLMYAFADSSFGITLFKGTPTSLK